MTLLQIDKLKKEKKNPTTYKSTKEQTKAGRKWIGFDHWNISLGEIHVCITFSEPRKLQHHWLGHERMVFKVAIN